MASEQELVQHRTQSKLLASTAGWRAQSADNMRQLFGRMFGLNRRTRNLYDVFGWDVSIGTRDLWEMYRRGGIAKRIVHAYGDATWGSPPTVTGTTAFTKAFQSLIDDNKLWNIVHRLDKLSQLGQYAVLLVGTDSPNLEAPMQNASKILYLQPYGETSAVITQWGTDPGDPRFGLPMIYTIYPNREKMQELPPGTSTSGVPTTGSFRVHWSRVIHIAQGQLESDLFGQPLLWSCWNYLTDLMKVVGGSAESYWLTANRGMQADIDKEMDMNSEDEAALSQEIDDYHLGLRRFIRTRGVKINNLGSDVADPSGPFGTLLTLIAGATGIPSRILVGSEAAHMASTQDKGAWAQKIEEYRALIAQPNFLGPLIDGFTRMGFLPTIAKKPVITWPDAYRLSPLEIGQMLNQVATAANNLGLAVKNMPKTFSVQEIRRMIGSAFDMRLLTNMSADPPIGDTQIETPVVAPTTKSPDGGTAKSGPGSGNTATDSTDSNGSGDTNSGKH